jgi:hypothetical protein
MGDIIIDDRKWEGGEGTRIRVLALHPSGDVTWAVERINAIMQIEGGRKVEHKSHTATIMRNSTESVRTADPSFAAPGLHAIFGFKREGSFFVSVDGAETGPYDEIGPFVVGENGKHIAYTFRRGHKWYVCADNAQSGPYTEVGAMAYSPDEQRFGFCFQQEGQWFVHVDGKDLGPYEGAKCLHLGNGPSRSSFCFSRGGKAYAWIGGEELGPYDDVPFLSDSSDETQKGLVIERGGSQYVWVNGTEYGPFRFGVPPEFSETGRRTAFSFIEQDAESVKLYAWVDGKPTYGPFAGGGSPRFSADGRRVMFSCHLKEATGGITEFICLDGRLYGPFEDVKALQFTPTGNAIGVVRSADAEGRRRDVLWVDGGLGPAYEHIFADTLRVDKTAAAFVSGARGVLYFVRQPVGTRGPGSRKIEQSGANESRSSIVPPASGGIASTAVVLRLRGGDPTALAEVVLSARPSNSITSWSCRVPLDGTASRTLVAYSLKAAETKARQAEGERAFRQHEVDVWRLAGITKPFALVLDRAAGDIILVGETGARGELTLDDLAVALRARLLHPDAGLGVTIGRPDSTHPNLCAVRFFGDIETTRFGEICLDAHRLMEGMALGLEDPRISGLRSYADLVAEAAAEERSPATEVIPRLWFYPADVRLQVRRDMVLLENLRVALYCEAMHAQVDGKPVVDAAQFRYPPLEDFARGVSEKYTELAAIHDQFANLEGLYRLLALAKGLAELEEKPALTYWLERYRLALVETPTQVPALRVERSAGGRRIDIRLW